MEQLVEEVLVAWDELGKRNDELVAVKQRLRVVELDLAERQDNVAPEVARLAEAEQTLKENEDRPPRTVAFRHKGGAFGPTILDSSSRAIVHGRRVESTSHPDHRTG